jgi:hypothetical protein
MIRFTFSNVTVFRDKRNRKNLPRNGRVPYPEQPWEIYPISSAKAFILLPETCAILTLVQVSEPPRRLLHETGEHAVEIALASESDPIGDFGDGEVGSEQIFLGLVDSVTENVIGRRDARDSP